MNKRRVQYFTLLACGLLLMLWAVLCVLGGVMWRVWRREKLDWMLITAIRQNNPNAVAASLKAGANANALESHTPPVSFWKFCQASVPGSKPIGKRSRFLPIFLVEPDPVDCGDAHHHIRFPGKKIAVIKLLLNYGADINARDEQGCTELIHAVEHDQEDVVKFLLQQKARLDIKDKQGYTAFAHACMNNQPHLAHLLQ